MQAGSATSDGIAHSLNGFVLSYHTLVQFLLQVKQLLALALQHTAYWNTCPTAHHIGDIVGSHLLLHHSFGSLRLMQFILNLLDILLQLLQFAIAYFGHSSVVALSLGFLCLKLELLHLLLVLLNLVDQSTFSLPLAAESLLLLLQVGYLLVQSL